MLDGIYKVRFEGPETGSGIVVVQGTKFVGGDGYFFYSGVFSQHVGELEATFEVKRHTPGTASVFGRDSLTATLTGLAGNEEFFLEAPGKAFTVTGKRLESSILDDPEKPQQSLPMGRAGLSNINRCSSRVVSQVCRK
jgi:hypothetical protein